MSGCRRAARAATLVLVLAGCGGASPAPPDRGASAPLVGPGSALARACPAPDPARGQDARAAQREAGQLLGLDVGLRFEVASPTAGSPCPVATLAQEVGASVVREDFEWGDVEPRPGSYDWAAADRLVDAAARRGLTVLPILVGSPDWRVADMDAAYGRYAGEVARRYGPGGPFWQRPGAPDGPPIELLELWNEPYVAINPLALSATAYARRARVGIEVARTLAPQARFLLAGETRYQPLDDGDVRPSYLADVLDAEPELGRLVDGIAVHPYGATPAPYDPADTATNQPGRVEAIRAELVARGLGRLGLWVTEIGWSTCTDTSVCVAPEQQADDLRRFLALARTRWRSYIRLVVVYQLRDAGAPGSDPADLYGSFGLLDPQGRPKPAFAVVRDALGGAG